MDTDDTLADQLSPQQSTEHPIVTAMKNFLGGLMPSAQAADQSKMIGGNSYMSMAPDGTVSEFGIKLKPEETVPRLQSYIARQQKAMADNQASAPQIWNGPSMKKIKDDMQEQITNAQEILAKVQAKNKPKAAQ